MDRTPAAIARTYANAARHAARIASRLMPDSEQAFCAKNCAEASDECATVAEEREAQGWTDGAVSSMKEAKAHMDNARGWRNICRRESGR